jgi:hypothetical protein
LQKSCQQAELNLNLHKKEKTMIIANPIYDVVFKYLLEDLEIAKELLSTILGVKVLNVTVKSQEELVVTDVGEIRIFRVDFKAVIEQENGEQKKVLIELQKAKQSYDLLRFRKYLGKNYIEAETRKNKKGKDVGYAIEIITIYFLGFELAYVPIPVLNVKRNYIDAITGTQLNVNEEFINMLTHESYTIQIPRLKLKQQSEMEQVLEIFSQAYVTEDAHRVDFKGQQVNPLVQKIVRRLKKAAASEKLREEMDAEDAIDRILGKKDEIIEEKDAIIKQKESLLEEKDSLLEEKDSLLEQERQDKERLLEELEQLKAFMKSKL